MNLVKKKELVFGLALLLVLAGCVLGEGTGKNQGLDNNVSKQSSYSGGNSVDIVEKGDSVKVEYVGKFPEGEVFDKSEGRGPLEFVAGAGQMIKGFDDAVMGMKLNEEKTVIIPPEDAYGKEGDGQKIEIPVEQIGDVNEVKVGTAVYTSAGQQGKVIAIEGEIATVEFGHPMAGKTLEFWIKIVEIIKE